MEKITKNKSQPTKDLNTFDGVEIPMSESKDILSDTCFAFSEQDGPGPKMSKLQRILSSNRDDDFER